MYFFDLDEIIRFEANSNYTFLYFANGSKMLASKTLKEFEELLPPKQFFQGSSFLYHQPEICKKIPEKRWRYH